MVSLGQGIAGAFTPSDEMAAKIATASSETGADGSLGLLRSAVTGGQAVAATFGVDVSASTRSKPTAVCAGEKTWRQPLEDSYWEIMKSPIADMKNAGSRYACVPGTFCMCSSP